MGNKRSKNAEIPISMKRNSASVCMMKEALWPRQYWNKRVALTLMLLLWYTRTICVCGACVREYYGHINLYEIRGWASKSQMAKENVRRRVRLCWESTVVMLLHAASAFTNSYVSEMLIWKDGEIMLDARSIWPKKKCIFFSNRLSS